MSHISYSELKEWTDCPWKHKLNYIDKHRTFTDSIHTVFGTAMHEVIQVYLHVLYNKSVSEADSLDLDLLLKDRMHTIVSQLMEDEKFEHRGIARRKFRTRLPLTEDWEVTGAFCEDGILSVNLVREVPEEKKPKTIEIK